jgi:hypothetical protein
MSAGSIGRFLSHVRESGVPAKVTTKYLETVGFKSSNDRQLVPIMKAIGFLDSSGTPTEVWKRYRGAGGKATLTDAIRSAYTELFAVYPDAQLRDDEVITNFIRGHTDYSARVVDFALKTFRALCAEADFTATSGAPHTTEAAPASTVVTAGTGLVTATPTLPAGTASSATVNINIQLTLPASDDGKLYDEFFAAMKKHLFE